MIAAMDAVHEGNALARRIRHPQPENPVIELDRLGNVAGEDQHMRHAAGPNNRRVGIGDGAPLVGRDRNIADRGFLVRRGFFRDADFDQVPVLIVKPEPVAFETRRCVSQHDALGFHVATERFEIVFENSERQERHLLARPF